MNNKNNKGFTLVEIIIVLGIISILATVAMPSYVSYIQKGNRVYGIIAIQNTLAAQERYYMNNRTYTTDFSKLGVPSKSNKSVYTLTLRACGSGLSSCVEVTATPNTAQQDDGVLIADSMGNQTRRVGGSNKGW